MKITKRRAGPLESKDHILISLASYGNTKGQYTRSSQYWSTEQGGFGYPGVSLRPSVSLPGLPSGLKRQRQRDGISACCTLQAIEQGGKARGVIVLFTDRALIR